MSNFQRRHYEAIASVLAYSNAREATILYFMDMLARDNYNFDRLRFRGRIAGLKSPAK